MGASAINHAQVIALKHWRTRWALRLRRDAAKRYRKANRPIGVISKMLVLAEQAFRKLHATKLTANIYLEVNYVNGIAMEGTVGVVGARSCLNKNGRDISRPVVIANLNSTGMGGVGSLV